MGRTKGVSNVVDESALSGSLLVGLLRGDFCGGCVSWMSTSLISLATSTY